MKLDLTDKIESAKKRLGVINKGVQVKLNQPPEWFQPRSFDIIHSETTPTEGWKTVSGSHSTTVII